jgi:DNA repair/transcription protein MET18/MMS19
MQETFWGQEIADTSIASERRAHAIKTWVWVSTAALIGLFVLLTRIQISKGLLVRNHPNAMRFVDRLFEVLGDEQIGWNAARGIGEIGSTDKVLTKRNYAIIRVHSSVRCPPSESDTFHRSSTHRSFSTVCCRA